MDPCARAQFPHPRVRLIIQPKRLLAGCFQAMEVLDARLHVQPPVEKHLHRAENDVSVDVVLGVPIGLIAGAHRSHAAIARQVGDRPLGQIVVPADPVDWLQTTSVGR